MEFEDLFLVMLVCWGSNDLVSSGELNYLFMVLLSLVSMLLVVSV